MAVLAINVQGLSLCHFNQDRMAVAMANSGRNPSLKIPKHLQTLILPKAAVDAGDTSADGLKVTLLGRVRDDLTDAAYWGWNLEGYELSVGPGSGAPARKPPVSRDRHPDPHAPDWADMRWVMDIKRFSPGSLMFPDVLEVSSEPRGFSRAVAWFTGGQVAGSPPQRKNRDCNHIWEFSPQYEQAVTDSLVYTLRQREPIVLTLSNASATFTITVSTDAVGHLMNEATPGDIAGELPGGVARHARAYFELFHHVLGVPEAPIRRTRFRTDDGGGLIEGVFCIILSAGAD
jgi:hypothetical protein